MKNKGKINVRGNFMKKINNLIAIFLVGLMGIVGMGTVYADEPNAGTSGSGTAGNGTSTPNAGASGSTTTTQKPEVAGGKVTVDCDNYKIAVGASTNCTVYVTANSTLAAVDTQKAVVVTMSQSKYITINNIVANTANGYSLDSDGNINDRTLANHLVKLTQKGKLTEGKKTAIMSFRLKLEEEAKNLKQGECGELCVDGAEFSNDVVKATLVAGDTGKACPNVIITEQKCTGDNCNPKTGAFMNYAVVALVAGVALVVIAVVSRKKKFYTV